MTNKISIIGGGNLGSAIAEGLIHSGFIEANALTITKRNVDTLKDLKSKGVNITSNNLEAIEKSQYIILAVKPFQTKEVLEQIRPSLQKSKHIIISVVTGIWINDIEEVIGKEYLIYRAMPNTAIAIKESMTCICSNSSIVENTLYIERLFNNLGKVVFIEEKLMDAATVLAACGTAYAMRFIRAYIQGGIEIGFSAKIASLIAAQTVKGAAELLLQKNTHPEQEIDKVTTPKGCTIVGLNEMEHQGFSSSLIKGIATSYKKIVDM